MLKRAFTARVLIEVSRNSALQRGAETVCPLEQNRLERWVSRGEAVRENATGNKSHMERYLKIWIRVYPSVPITLAITPTAGTNISTASERDYFAASGGSLLGMLACACRCPVALVALPC